MKLKHYTLLLFFVLLSAKSIGQTYGNEWINYSQQYYTFQITQQGIYRLDYAALTASGIPVSSFQSANIQIFGKEKEIPLFVSDGGDNSLDPGDYILFYAQGNDGWLDSTLYSNPNTIGNPQYSLYNDTLLYFFTWNSSTNNNRYVIETDVNFSNYSSVANYILCNAEYNANYEYFDGYRTSDASSARFVRGEGWGAPRKNGVDGAYVPDVISLNTPLPYTGVGAPNAFFKGRSVSSSDAGNTINHHLKWELGSTNAVMLDSTWKGYDQALCNRAFSPSLLTNGNTNLTFRIIDDLNAASDYQAYQYVSIRYPRIPDLNGANTLDFEAVNDPQGKIRLDFANSGISNAVAFVHGDVPRMIPFAANGGSYSALIPNSTNGVNQSVILRDASLIQNVSALSAVNGTGTFTNYANEPLEAALLMIYHPSLTNASQAYESYRDVNYNAYLVNVEELYLQFGGGIEKHALGIRRFVHFAYNNTTAKPVGLFLMGKGIREASYNQTTFDGPGTRKSTARFQQSLIPSFGQPSSDICLTARLQGATDWNPLIPTGRISVQSDPELAAYLSKVNEYETEQDQNSVYDTPNKDWQKHILHFAGGSNSNEQALFQGKMNVMETTISDSLFGGYVHRVYKSSSNPLDPTILNSVTDRIASGVSLMTYFGHASGTNSGFEINLDDPQNWNNHGKYPVMLVNSCYNGNVFQSSLSKSEEFVQASNYGAIAYIASVSLGISTSLGLYSQELYRELGYKKYGATLGEIMKETVTWLELSPYDDFNMETTSEQMVLNGDPMLRLNWHSKPEIELTADDISFSPSILDLTVDSLEMQINLTNLGRSITDTFEVQITRNFPSSSVDSLYSFFIPKLNYTDTLRFKMPLQPNISIGQNTFDVKIDIPSIIDEQYEEITNNQIVRSLLIDIDGITPVIPYEFAVVPIDSVTVKASTTDPLAPFATYRFEMDTVDFEGTVPQSAEYRYALVSGLGGVKEVNPSQWLSVANNSSMPLVCEDSVVYFWRVSIDGDTNWRESSFQYITGRTGWGQDHFYQFKKNSFYNVGYERVPRERTFDPLVKELECNVNSSVTPPGYYYNNYLINGEQKAYGIGEYSTDKIVVAVIDPVTLLPWDTTGHHFGSLNDGGYNFKAFYFPQNNITYLENFQNMVLNEVPNGHHLLIYCPMRARHDLWNSLDSLDMYNTFAALGSDSVAGDRPNRPFIFYVKKGDFSTVQEGYALVQGGELQIKVDIDGADYGGRETSTLIGPASNWGNVYWKQDPKEFPTDDSTSLHIIGYDIFGVQQVDLEQVFTSNDSLLNLNGLIDANLYPYISLRADYIDSTTNTPAQIDRWHVLFSPLPEAAIDGSSGYYWSAGVDPIHEGEDIQFAVDVRNIFNIDMDSLLVDYWIEDENQMRIPINYSRQDSLRVPDILRDTITFSTIGMSGINSFWMEINPYVSGSFFVTDQPEQEHFNNLLQIPFFVEEDDEQPILDVTFNGNHILNGDIIDPNGEILITLKDDNPYLVMDNISDTALFGIYLTDPLGIQKRIPFMDAQGNTILQWIPANAQNLRFQIVWPTEFQMDGKYSLSVQGSDRSGNLSGDLQYLVNFEIIHESSITAMMNYPNPFSTSTRFVFTLTGSEVPDDILIQILTVSGRVIREISEDELGPIQIGRNITEFAWDGTDQFGDPLANGVYLYRVQTRLNGESIKHRDSGADSYFTKDFGKMYLMR